MSRFQPGDMVECVDVSPALTNTPRQIANLANLRRGEVYTVRGFGPSGGLILDVPSVPGNRGWIARRFRLVYRPKADMIERLMAEPTTILATLDASERVGGSELKSLNSGPSNV